MAVMAAAFIMLGTSACGSKKMASAEIKGEKLQAETVCQQLKEEKPAVRALGEGTNFSQSFAKTYAEGQARAEFARQLSSLVSTASKQSNDAANAYSSNGKKGNEVSDQALSSDAFAQQIAEQTIPGLVVIKTETYKRKDNQYHVFVCLEYMGTVNALAEELTNAYMARVKQMIPDEDREKMQVRHDSFFEQMTKYLQRINGTAN